MDGPPKDAVAALQIGELARRAEVSLRTVRYYEEEGLLPPAAKTSGGMRLYTEADVMRLRFIRRLRAWGLGLEEIKATLGVGGSSMSHSDRVRRTLEALRTERRRAQARLDEVQRLRAEIDAALASVERCVGCDADACRADCASLRYLI